MSVWEATSCICSYKTVAHQILRNNKLSEQLPELWEFDVNDAALVSKNIKKTLWNTKIPNKNLWKWCVVGRMEFSLIQMQSVDSTESDK